MRRLFRRLIVFASVLGVVMALNVGVAFAHDGGAPFPPIGSHLVSPGPGGPGAPGAINGFGFEFGVGQDLTNPAVIGITHNPNCPLHAATHA